MSHLNLIQNSPFNIRTDLFYVDLVIADKQHRLEEDYLTRTSMGQTHTERVQLEQVFSKLEGRDSPKTVQVVGAAGIGKSTVTQKIVHSWSTGDMWADRYDMVFHFRCRELAEVCGDRQYSMEELLLKVHGCGSQFTSGEERKIVGNIKDTLDKTLVIIDGLDELTSWTRAVYHRKFQKITRFDDKSDVPDIIDSIINGRLLKGADILTTCRPISQLERVHSDRRILIVGFDEDSVSDCIQSICKGESETHQKIMAHLDTHINLLHLCVVPFLCVLFGVISRGHIRSGIPIDVTNMTQLMIRSLYYIITKRDSQCVTPDGKSIKEPRKTNIHKLCKLAAHGTLGENIQLIFTTGDMMKHQLSSDDVTRTGLIEVSSGETSGEMLGDMNYSFLHFMFQEFLTAVHVCLTWKEEDVLLTSTFSSNSVRLDNVRLFMCGLFGDEDLGHTFPMALDADQPYRERAQQFFTRLCDQDTDNRQTRLQLIMCVHEGNMSDMEGVKEAVLSDNGLTLDLAGEVYGYDVLLPHQLASVGWFITNTQCIENIK